MPQVTAKVVDANGDRYNKQFEVQYNGECLLLICPDCGESVNYEAEEPSCANGHLAYTIIEEDIIDKVNDAWREAEE